MNPSTNQNRAGIFDGEQHSENGIPISLIDTKTNIEVEGGEFNFPEWVQNDTKTYTFRGTNYEVIQRLFDLIGAQWDSKVTHVKSGDIIICIRSAFDNDVRTYTGTITQILSAINESCGCKHVESGATMTNHETGEVKQMQNGGNVLPKEAQWIAVDALLEEPELLVLKNGGKIAQGYIIAPYSKLKGIFGEPNVKNSKEKIGWYMAIDKNHIGAIWTEADKSVKTIMKEKFHKWFVWGANEESQRRLYEATRSQVKDIDPVKQKEKDKAISVQRWVKKREHLKELAHSIRSIKINITNSLKEYLS